MQAQVTHLIETQQLSRAVIIDDAYDLPVVSQVINNSQAFLNCLRRDEDYDSISAMLALDVVGEDQLLHMLEQETTIRTLYDTRHDLPNGAGDALFSDFEQGQSTKQAELQHIIDLLSSVGLEVTTYGTSTQTPQEPPDILFVDLFLDDSLDAEQAADHAAVRVKPYVPNADNANESGPLIVLISSRIPDLNTVYARFRDSAEVPGCRFAFLAKRTFRESSDEALFRLHELIYHNPSSQQFDRFVRQMNIAANEAKTKFIKTLRRFELSDYADLTDLVVTAEGIPLKHYLLELFALTWASLAESTDALISALDRLQGLDLTVDKYPPNTFEPSDAVLDLYERALYRPPAALGDLSEFSDLGLGDILESRTLTNGVPTLHLVLVQDCDILRDKPPDAAFLIRGDVALHTHDRPNSVSSFPYASFDQRFTVCWNMKRWRVIRREHFVGFLDHEDLRRAGRLRSPWSLACQSRFFQRLTRPAEMAAPHEIALADIQVLIKDQNQQARVVLDFGGSTQGYLVTGRDNDRTKTRLVLSVNTAESLREKLRQCAVDEALYSETVRNSLNELLSDPIALDALRARLVVQKKKKKLPQSEPLNHAGTALDPSKYWAPNTPAQEYTIMINVRSIVPS